MGAVLDLLLRMLGLRALAYAGSRLSDPTARTITALVLIAANLLPIIAVLRGSAGAGDVFVLYWLENVVVWFTTTIKILTAAGNETSVAGRVGMAAFFAFHFGVFTIVHGVFSFVIAGITGGFHGGPWYWLVTVGAIFVSHVVSLGVNWFGRGERTVVTPQRAVAMPYPRMLVLHFAIIGGFFLAMRPWDGPPEFGDGASTLPVVLLCTVKTALDLVLHLRERRANSAVRPAPSRICSWLRLRRPGGA